MRAGGLTRRLLAGALLFCGAAARGAERPVFTRADAREAHATAAAFVEACTPRDGGTLRGRLAAGWLLDRVSRCGVDARLDTFQAETPFGEKTFCNVIVELGAAETNAPWIVVMSHFETAPTAKKPFAGANDGASTSGLLVALARVLHRAGPQRANIALVWTDGEECQAAYSDRDGFYGSRRLARQYAAAGRRVTAAVCLDMLGDEDLHVMVPANTTAPLKELALRAARAAGLDGLVRVVETVVVSDDHSAFLTAGMPAIDFIDFEYGPHNSWWHTPEDTMRHVTADSLEKAGRLAVSFLNLLCAPRPHE